MTLYLDLDGVLADFDTGANHVLGCDSHYKFSFVHGDEKMWDTLNAADEFFYNLPPMPDAGHLWDSVRHLNPIILTAVPKENPEASARQKRAWVAENLGIDVQVITCRTYEKPNYCLPGDILVDDRTVNAKLWNARGGDFIWHIDAISTLGKLQYLKAI